MHRKSAPGGCRTTSRPATRTGCGVPLSRLSASAPSLGDQLVDPEPDDHVGGIVDLASLSPLLISLHHRTTDLASTDHTDSPFARSASGRNPIGLPRSRRRRTHMSTARLLGIVVEDEAHRLGWRLETDQ